MINFLWTIWAIILYGVIQVLIPIFDVWHAWSAEQQEIYEAYQFDAEWRNGCVVRRLKREQEEIDQRYTDYLFRRLEKAGLK